MDETVASSSLYSMSIRTGSWAIRIDRAPLEVVKEWFFFQLQRKEYGTDLIVNGFDEWNDQ